MIAFYFMLLTSNGNCETELCIAASSSVASAHLLA
jgi:hypothetical protein